MLSVLEARLDGTEIMAILLNKKLPFSVGEIVMFFNIFIFITAGFVFGWDRAMYSLIAYFIAYKVMDLMIIGLEESKSVWIISENHKLIGDTILARLGRGVTYLSGEGAYTGDNKQVIFCVITRLEEAKLKSIVEEIDTSAFLAIANITEVRGGRFKKRRYSLGCEGGLASVDTRRSCSSTLNQAWLMTPSP